MRCLLYECADRIESTNGKHDAMPLYCTQFSWSRGEGDVGDAVLALLLHLRPVVQEVLDVLTRKLGVLVDLIGALPHVAERNFCRELDHLVQTT